MNNKRDICSVIEKLPNYSKLMIPLETEALPETAAESVNLAETRGSCLW